MLDLSVQNKALCFEDSKPKPLYIFIYDWVEDSSATNGGYWKYLTTIGQDKIIFESMELDEGILEGNNFELGSFVTHSMKVQWQNNGLRYGGMIAVPVQKIGSQYIAYFDGNITKEEISSDGQIVTAEITSFLSQKLDVDVMPMISQSNISYLPRLIDKVFAELKINADKTWSERMLNASATIDFDYIELPKSLTLNNFLKQLGEFFGCHISTQEKRVVSSLEYMTTYQPTEEINLDFFRVSNVETVSKIQGEVLPSNYERLPYIQSTGSQYILTDYVPNNNTSVEMQFYNFAKYEYPTDPSNPNLKTTALFGSRTEQEQNSFACFLSVNDLNEATFDFGNTRTKIDTKILRMRNFALKKGVASVDNISKTFSNTQSFSTNNNMTIFTVNTNGEKDERCAIGKLYSFKVFEGSTLKMDMIPCKDTTANECGLYDLVSKKFYTSATNAVFVSSNPIETYKLPYYINSMVDKTKSLSIDQIRVLTETGTQLNYTIDLKDKTNSVYEIKNNIFFDALSSQSWELCEKAVEEVGSYLSDLSLYYVDLETVYAPFTEGADYLLIPHKNQKFLPEGYAALEAIKFNPTTTNSPHSIISSITAEALNSLEFSISFVLTGDKSVIVDTYTTTDRNIFKIDYNNKKICVYFGGNYVSTSPTFEIENVPTFQKINLNIKTSGNTLVYSGTYSGEANFNINSAGKATRVVVGSANSKTDFKVEKVTLKASGYTRTMLPSLNQQSPCFYIVEAKAKTPITNSQNTDYETGDTVVPILSCNASGIHSMRANVLCKATNIKN